MPFIEVDLDDFMLDRLLEAKSEAPEKIAPYFAVVAEDLVAAVIDRIESEGDGQWAPLSEHTLKMRRMEGKGAKMLQDTGNLKVRIRPQSGSDFAAAATDVPYIVYHLDGGEIIPKRNPFEVPDEVFEEAAQLIADAIAATDEGGVPLPPS